MSYANASSLAGKVVIVTGAGRGVGRGIARALSKNGAALLLTDIDDATLQSAADEMRSYGASVESVQADLADRQAAETIVDAAVVRFHRLNGLVNNAI